ncbi:recombination regulator RecX [Halalkalibacter sp. AB-rgal2]|uniref:recombination regulator RecX n=1 Tax=Halalkalibacter sp. AB-rgal2 TaxID=3242695 RepID=UPI00359E7388
MVAITKIEVQKKNKSRYSIFVNRGNGEEYGFSVDEDVLVKYRLQKGQEINEKELRDLLDADEERKVYHLAIHYLSYRMRSRKEIRDYLIRKEKEEKYIDIAIKKLEQEKWLDDREFTRAYIQTKRLTQVKGPRKLKQELMTKGVNEEIIDAHLMEIPVEEWVGEVRKWLEKKGKQDKRLSQRSRKDKLVGQLYVKGYTEAIISEALSTFENEDQDREEWEAICYQGEKIRKKYRQLHGWEYNQKCKQALYRKGFSIDMIEQYLQEE